MNPISLFRCPALTSVFGGQWWIPIKESLMGGFYILTDPTGRSKSFVDPTVRWHLGLYVYQSEGTTSHSNSIWRRLCITNVATDANRSINQLGDNRADPKRLYLNLSELSSLCWEN